VDYFQHLLKEDAEKRFKKAETFSLSQCL